jgi:DNA-binding CsgD family transcriptional regulator
MLDVDGDIIERVYEAAVVPEFWPEALARLCEIVGAWGAGLLAFDPWQNMRFTATGNYLEGFTAFAAASPSYDNRRPKRALATGHVGFLHDLEIFTQAELDADPIYRDFLYRYGIKWTSGTVIPVPTSDLMVFDVSRREVDGQFSREMMLRLDQYRPHLAKAALLAHRLGLRVARAATEALETIGLPAAVLATGGRVLSANALLEGLTPRVNFLAFDRITLAAPGAAHLLAEAIRGLDRTTNSTVRSIALPATHGAPAQVLHVIPIRRAAGDIFTHATGLLVVTEVAAPTAPLREMLTGLFDLTAAEVHVARAVATGASVEEIASSRGVSRETVRTQLKSVLAKTGTRRQTELALLLSGARPVGSKAGPE